MRNSMLCYLSVFCAISVTVIPGYVSSCASTTPLVGFSSDLSMVQHQLRGVVEIVDDCTFKVTRFDMVAGLDVCWWGSLGEDFYNLTDGFPVSRDILNQTYSNSTFQVTLQEGLTWEQFRVLSVWDKATASDFGHLVLEPYVPAPIESLPPLESGQDGAPPLSPYSAWAPVATPPFYANVPVGPPSDEITTGQSQPTMFDNCVELSPAVFRARWTVNWESGTVDIGLEAALGKSQYMAFGWAQPGQTTLYMMHADVVVAGFDERGMPFAEDYYLKNYSECNWDSNDPSGVCPDSFFGSKTVGLNNSKLVYAQQIDGISLIRYNRPLQSVDIDFDVAINTSLALKVIWALGTWKQADSAKHRTPQNHGINYGYLSVTLGNSLDQCVGPLVAVNSYTGEVVVADRGTILIVGTDVAVHYPNPPFPKKVLYINQKEAPLLRVERGVPVTFVIQAGHDVGFYVTSDPVGGASNKNEIVYAGGSDAEGVPTAPYALTWLPNRSTPDQVFYQDYFQKKMGWKVQVVDGGLSDMYNSTVSLADNQVTLFWTMTASRIYFAVRGEVKSSYVAIAFGSGMVNSFSYVGWIDNTGIGHISTYWMDGKQASSVHPTEEDLLDQKCETTEGIVTFEFSRPLQPVCGKGHECKNVIDPATALKVVWAIGDTWSSGDLTEDNMHTMTSSRPTLVSLFSGAAKVEQLQPVLAVHGFMMFIAWGLLLPGGVLAARYLKYLDQNGWFEIHMYSQLGGIAVALLGLLFAVAELRGFNTGTAHMKVGMISIGLVCLQAFNGYIRPKNSLPGESLRPQRIIWRYIHIYSGRTSLVLGFVALVTGISQLARRDGVEHMKGLQWALFAWFLAVAAVVCYVEFQGFFGKRQHNAVIFDKILGSEEDLDDLLPASQDPFISRDPKEIQPSPVRGMEIQLEAVH